MEHGASEWDFVAESLDGEWLLLGEAKWSPHAFSAEVMEREAARLLMKSRPAAMGVTGHREVVLALAAIMVAGKPRLPHWLELITGDEIFGV